MSVESGGAPSDDRSMAEGLRDAGRDVFAYLYESFAAPLFDYCAGILRDSWAAAEVVQDSLVAVDAHMNKLPDPDQVRLWLYTTARQQCLVRLPGHQLAGRSETVTLDEFIGEQAGSTDRYPDAGTVATEREKLRILTAALDSLPDRDREIVSLAYRHGIADDNLAAVLGVNRRRADAMLSGAGEEFRASATVIAVLRAGRPGARSWRPPRSRETTPRPCWRRRSANGSSSTSSTALAAPSGAGTGTSDPRWSPPSRSPALRSTSGCGSRGRRPRSARTAPRRPAGR